MFLTHDDVIWLMWHALWAISLLICLITLLVNRNIRHFKTGFSWVVLANLIAGALYLASFHAATLQESWFAARDRNYPNLPFEGHSLYIPDPAALGAAAYDCSGVYSDHICLFPVTERIQDGTLNFVEIGTNPIKRYELRVHDEGCVDEAPIGEIYEFYRGVISPGLGICVLGRDVPEAQADHILTVSMRNLSFPSRETYYHAELIRRADGVIINAFDNIYRVSDNEMKSGPKGDTDALLNNRQRGPFGYDRATDNALLEKYGLDQKIMRRAAASPYQSYRADTFFLACRKSLQDVLTQETIAALKQAAGSLFKDDPDWTFPDDCPPFAR